MRGNLSTPYTVSWPPAARTSSRSSSTRSGGQGPVAGQRRVEPRVVGRSRTQPEPARRVPDVEHLPAGGDGGQAGTPRGGGGEVGHDQTLLMSDAWPSSTLPFSPTRSR